MRETDAGRSFSLNAMNSESVKDNSNTATKHDPPTNRGRGRGRDRGGPRQRGRGSQGSRRSNATGKKCNFCGHPNHFKKECRLLQKIKEKNPELVKNAPNFKNLGAMNMEGEVDRLMGFDSDDSKNE